MTEKRRINQQENRMAPVLFLPFHRCSCFKFASLLDPPTCLDLICSGHATVKFSFGTRLMRLMVLIIGEEVKFLSLRVLRVFKPQLPVFRTEPHVHEKLQRDNER